MPKLLFDKTATGILDFPEIKIKIYFFAHDFQTNILIKFLRAKIPKMNSDNPLIWVEISRSALIHNFQTFREIVGAKVALAPMIKSNAYGHGLEICASIFREAGADYLAVNSIFEAEKIRSFGDRDKIYVAGYTPLAKLKSASEHDIEFAVFNFVRNSLRIIFL